MIKKIISRFKKKSSKISTETKVRAAIREYFDGESLRNLYYLIDRVEINCLGESSEVKITTVETDLIGAMIGTKGKHIKGMKKKISEQELIQGDFKIQMN